METFYFNMRTKIMIKKKQNKSVIEVDLTSPQGNAFYLLGLASQLSKQLGLDEVEILQEMQTSNYENLVKVFDKHFGKFVILYR
jgi:DNA-binding transcriptional regulator LsrR (DeoR family)